MSERFLTHVLDVAKATLSLRRTASITPDGVAEEAAGPGEFSVLHDCYAQDGIIKPRRRIARIIAPNQHRRVLSLGELRMGDTMQTWVVASAVSYDNQGKVAPMALLLTRSKTGLTVSVKRDGTSTLPFGVPFAFWSYKNKLWSSNGLYSQVFDGGSWGDRNGQADGTDEIAARFGMTIESKFLLCNTPTYPDEYTWADPLVDIPVNNKWPGMAPGGGTGVGVPLYSISAPSPGVGLFVVGGAGTVIRSLNNGLSWYSLPSPSDFTLRSISLTPVTSGGATTIKGYVAGMHGSSAPNVFWTEDASQEGVGWEIEGLGIDVYDIAQTPTITGEKHGDFQFVGYLGGSYQSGVISIWDSGSGSWMTLVLGKTGSIALGAKIIAIGATWYSFVCGSKNSDGTSFSKTKATGGNWVDFVPGGATSVDFNSVSAVVDSTNYVVFLVGNDAGSGRTYRYKSSSAAWTTVVMPPGSESLVPYHVLMIDKNTVYAVGERGLIMKCVNADDITPVWTAQDCDVTVQLNRIINYDASDPLKLCVVGDGGVFISTVNGGTIWVEAGVGRGQPRQAGELRPSWNGRVAAGRFAA